jgi:aspartyl-tRNA synthetase
MELLDTKTGDLILFALGEQSSANQILGRLRLFIAHKLEVIDTVSHKLSNMMIPIAVMLYTLLMTHR